MKNLSASLYERARIYVKRQNTARLGRELGLPAKWEWSYELLRTLAAIRAMLAETPPVLVDVGAHKGIFSAAADRVLQFRRIICVEPDTDLLDQLKGAAPGDKSTIKNVALSSEEGEAEFFVHRDRSMNSLLRSDAQRLATLFPTDSPERIQTTRVRTTTIDSLLDEEGALNGDRLFLKLDTQGNELDVLRAGRRTLERTDACLVEFMFASPYEQRHGLYELVKELHEYGLTCRGALDISRRPTNEVSAVDFLFTREK